MSDATARRPRLRLMTVHAHPDDETISTGGVYLRCADAGIPTILVCCTNGEEGEIVDPELNNDDVRARLGEVRRQELACAAAILRVSTVEYLGYRDSGMARTSSNEHLESFHQAPLREAAEKLVRLVRRYRPHVVISYDPNGSYGHPDHVKAHQITREAFARAADPSFAPTPNLLPWQPVKLYETTVPREAMIRWRDRWREEQAKKAEEAKLAGQPPEEARDGQESENGEWFDLEKYSTPLERITTRIDVAEFLATRREALRCHRTQIAADSDFFRESDDADADFWRHENFNRRQTLVRAPEKEQDLFAGLR